MALCGTVEPDFCPNSAVTRKTLGESLRLVELPCALLAWLAAFIFVAGKGGPLALLEFVLEGGIGAILMIVILATLMPFLVIAPWFALVVAWISVRDRDWGNLGACFFVWAVGGLLLFWEIRAGTPLSQVLQDYLASSLKGGLMFGALYWVIHAFERATG